MRSDLVQAQLVHSALALKSHTDTRCPILCREELRQILQTDTLAAGLSTDNETDKYSVHSAVNNLRVVLASLYTVITTGEILLHSLSSIVWSPLSVAVGGAVVFFEALSAFL